MIFFQPPFWSGGSLHPSLVQGAPHWRLNLHSSGFMIIFNKVKLWIRQTVTDHHTYSGEEVVQTAWAYQNAWWNLDALGSPICGGPTNIKEQNRKDNNEVEANLISFQLVYENRNKIMSMNNKPRFVYLTVKEVHNEFYFHFVSQITIQT